MTQRPGRTFIYEHCAECHGYDGKAEVIVMHMDEPPRDQTDVEYMKLLNDQFLYLAICKGGEAIGKSIVMPGWGDMLTDQDIRDLVAWIRTFSALNIFGVRAKRGQTPFSYHLSPVDLKNRD